MRIGVDFDNTIACYDGIFHAVAMKHMLVPANIGTSKDSVRNYLRAVGRENDWTELQGLVYGAHMAMVPPYPGVIDFFRRCIAFGIDIYIVSHKTRSPYRGKSQDLHAAARSWLTQKGFFNDVGLPDERVFFELTKQDKLARIGALKCDVFIDDLPEFLAEPQFPQNVDRVLFDPLKVAEITPFRRMHSWNEIEAALLPKDLR